MHVFVLDILNVYKNAFPPLPSVHVDTWSHVLIYHLFVLISGYVCCKQFSFRIVFVQHSIAWSAYRISTNHVHTGSVSNLESFAQVSQIWNLILPSSWYTWFLILASSLFFPFIILFIGSRCSLAYHAGLLDCAAKCRKHPMSIGKSSRLQLYTWSQVLRSNASL